MREKREKFFENSREFIGEEVDENGKVV